MKEAETEAAQTEEVVEPRNYVTIVELANRLGTNRRTIYRWIREGKMEADVSTKAEFKVSFEEADRISGEWDFDKKRLKKEKAADDAVESEVE